MIIETIQDYFNIRNTLQDTYLTTQSGMQIFVPCTNVLIVNRNLIQANTYNPNGMPDSKKESLQESITIAGWAYPITAIFDEELEKFVIVDGFHRWLIAGYDYLGLEYVPLSILKLNIADRMIATILFNKARGFHQVDLDADVIRALIEQGLDEVEISEKLGIDLETVYRYKQVTGIAELFKNQPYSKSWEIMEIEINE